MLHHMFHGLHFSHFAETQTLLLLQMLYIYDKINDSICAEFISELFNKPNLKFGKKWRLAWNKKY